MLLMRMEQQKNQAQFSEYNLGFFYFACGLKSTVNQRYFDNQPNKT